MRNIKFDIIDTCSTINTDNEAITILLKDSQDSISISTIYIPPVSTTNTTPLNNITNSADNVIITGDLDTKHTNFNYTKTDKWELFIADRSKPTHRDSRTNISLIKYKSDHSAILFDFSTNINKSTPPPIKVKLYHKADWDSINSSLSKQLAILQDQINFISSDNPDPVNIINNATTILTDSIVNIHNNLPENLLKQIPVCLSLFKCL